MLPRFIPLCAALFAAQCLVNAEPGSNACIEQQAWEFIATEKPALLSGHVGCVAREIEVPDLRETMDSRLFEISLPPTAETTSPTSYPVCWVLSFAGRMTAVAWRARTQEASSWVVHDGSLFFVAGSGSGVFSSWIERCSIDDERLTRYSSPPYLNSSFRLAIDSSNALVVREHWTLGRVVATSSTTLAIVDRNGVERTPDRYGLELDVARELVSQGGGEIQECSVHEIHLARLKECMPATLYLVQQDEEGGAIDKPARTYLLELKEKIRVPGSLEVYSGRKDGILDLANFSTETRTELLPETNAIFTHERGLYVCFRPQKAHGPEIRKYQYIDGKIRMRRSGSFPSSVLSFSTTPNGEIKVSSAESTAATAARASLPRKTLGKLTERGDTELVIVDNRGRIVEPDARFEKPE